MTVPVQITLRRVRAWPETLELLQAQADSLRHVHPEVRRCHVVLERESGGRRRGDRFRVSVQVFVPGGPVLAERRSARGGEPSFPWGAVAEAFNACRRRLAELSDRRLSRASPRPAFAAPAGLFPSLLPVEACGVH